MDCTSRALPADRTILRTQRWRGEPPRALRVGVLILLALVLGTRAAQPQSCAGKVAGEVCRAAAGPCDVAESCAVTGPGGAGTPLYQPTDGTLVINGTRDFITGYAFTPNKALTVTSLGGYFNGTRTVYLFNRSTGALLASTPVTSANAWAYATITPVTLTAGTPYSVAVYTQGSGGSYRTGMTSMPSTLADATIDGTCYRPTSTAEPCASSGLVAGTNYGMVDIKYTAPKPLYQPTDGTLFTDGPGDYTVGYAFTPNKALTVSSLGGFFNCIRTVYLFNRSTGATLASATVTSANNWAYTAITPVTLAAGTAYSVAVYLPGTGGAYRSGVAMPSTLADATIDGSCYRPSAIGEPCASSGLVSGANYGMTDLKYTVSGNGLVCPADSFRPAGNVCRSASGTCDVAETCSGSSAACPSNLFKASGISCDDGQLCTYGDVCNGAGSCGGTTVTCGGGNACSTTACNGTSTCETAKVFCNAPPSECYNILGSCNTSNGSCSYTVKVGAPCGTRGTCQASGACYTPPPIASNGIPADCASQTLPVPTPIGCDSCDPNHPCVIDSTVTVPAEYQTCSGYTPRKGDIVVHEADGLTQMLVSKFGSNWTHVGVFLGSQQGSNAQLVRHHSLNLDGLSSSVIQPDTIKKALIALSLNKNSAYCKSAKLDAGILFDPGQFLPGVPNSHTADMITESNGNGGLYWETGVHDRRRLIIANNRTLAEDAANQMVARNDYYSLNSLVDEAKGRARLSGNKPGTNCASAIMSCITPTVAPTLLRTNLMRDTAKAAYEAIRRQVRWMPETESAVSACKAAFCPPLGLPCPVDCNGIAWETANGIADQVIACFLFGPTANGCECTRDNRKWHFANWAGAAPAPPTQDDTDWVNNRLTDVEFYQDTWTSGAAVGQSVTNIYESYSYLPGDVMNSSNYPASNAYPLVKKTNATRNYGHCYVPPTITVTPSPTMPSSGTPITWTVTVTGGAPASTQYALFRRRSGTSPWTPDVSSPAWQTSNVLSWTPTSGELGNWDIYVWAKDGNTPGNMNVYGYAASYNPGGVQVVAPLTVTGTVSPSSGTYGTTFTYTATASGGNPATRKFAFFRRRGGTSNWIPDVNNPNWQTGNTFTWVPNSSDVASWETYIWVKDGNTPANMTTYGYAAGTNTGVIQVTAPGVVQQYPAKGWVDGYNTQHIWGWACDPDYPTQSNRVDVYSTTWQVFGSGNANIGSVAAINSACLGGTAHYFDHYPSGGIPSGTHFNVWSIDLPYATPGNDNRKLSGSGAIGDGTEFVMP